MTDSSLTFAPTPSPHEDALRARALRVIPGGMYGHMRVGADNMPAGYPQFYVAGRGATLTDVDGREYTDFLCAFGPMLLGYAHPVVDEAAAAQQKLGDPFTGPTPRLVELAEALVDTVAHADWAMFAKNGTDATSMAVVTARAATGRTKLLKARAAYHGANAWFTPQPAGVTAADRADIVEFDYNDTASLQAAASAHDGDVAAIILPPFRHDALADQELVDPAFARAARELATRIGAALILDEVRTCLRLDAAGAWESIGVRPDITAFSKSLGNGYPISAIVGVDSLREAAQSIYVTGSFWQSGVPMAAALATLEIVRTDDTIATIARAGERLRSGLAAQAARHGFDLVQTGPAQMPMVRFADDPRLELGFAFTGAAARRGVLLHPWHNMFLSAAHTDEVIDAALERTDEAFAEVRTLTP